MWSLHILPVFMWVSSRCSSVPRCQKHACICRQYLWPRHWLWIWTWSPLGKQGRDQISLYTVCVTDRINLSTEAAVSVSLETLSQKHRIFLKASSRKQSLVSGGQTETGSEIWAQRERGGGNTEGCSDGSTLAADTHWGGGGTSPASQTQQLARVSVSADDTFTSETQKHFPAN